MTGVRGEGFSGRCCLFTALSVAPAMRQKLSAFNSDLWPLTSDSFHKLQRSKQLSKDRDFFETWGRLRSNHRLRSRGKHLLEEVCFLTTDESFWAVAQNPPLIKWKALNSALTGSLYIRIQCKYFTKHQTDGTSSSFRNFVCFYLCVYVLFVCACMCVCVRVCPHHPCPASAWWWRAPLHWACNPASAWPCPAPVWRWNHSHHDPGPWTPHGSLHDRHMKHYSSMSQLWVYSS